MIAIAWDGTMRCATNASRLHTDVLPKRFFITGFRKIHGNWKLDTKDEETHRVFERPSRSSGVVMRHQREPGSMQPAYVLRTNAFLYASFSSCSDYCRLEQNLVNGSQNINGNWKLNKTYEETYRVFERLSRSSGLAMRHQREWESHGQHAASRRPSHRRPSEDVPFAGCLQELSRHSAAAQKPSSSRMRRPPRRRRWRPTIARECPT